MSVQRKMMVTIPRGCVFDVLVDDCEEEVDVAVEVVEVVEVTLELELSVVEEEDWEELCEELCEELWLELTVELWDVDAPLAPEPAKKKMYAAAAATIRSTMARAIAIGAIPLPL